MTPLHKIHKWIHMRVYWVGGGACNKIERLLPSPIILHCLSLAYTMYMLWFGDAPVAIITDVLVSEFCAAVKIGSLLYTTPKSHISMHVLKGVVMVDVYVFFMCIYVSGCMHNTSQILLYKFSLSYRCVTSISFLVQIMFISCTMRLCWVGISEYMGRTGWVPWVYSCYIHSCLSLRFLLLG